jgi:hypothetical protein
MAITLAHRRRQTINHHRHQARTAPKRRLDRQPAERIAAGRAQLDPDVTARRVRLADHVGGRNPQLPPISSRIRMVVTGGAVVIARPEQARHQRRDLIWAAHRRKHRSPPRLGPGPAPRRGEPRERHPLFGHARPVAARAMPPGGGALGGRG